MIAQLDYKIPFGQIFDMPYGRNINLIGYFMFPLLVPLFTAAFINLSLVFYRTLFFELSKF